MNTVIKLRTLRSFRAETASIFCAILTLAGCATNVDTARLPLSLPSAWSEVPTMSGAAMRRDWWTGYGSDELVRLVDEGRAANVDLLIAAERVRQAETTARLAGASLFPVFDVQAGAATSYGKSGNGGFSGAAGASGDQSSAVSLGISYEVDLWGRVAAVERGARASLVATRFDLETAQLAITSGIASGYFQVLALRMRLAVARDNLAIAERVSGIVEARYRFGSAAALDVSRQRTTVLSARAAVLPLETQERQTISALAILIGRPPENLRVDAPNLDAMIIPQVATGLPSELLTRRPDLASAEAQLSGADANVAAARAALLPAVALTGSAGLSSSALLGLSNPAWGAELAASFVRSLFDADGRKSQVAVNESSRRQLVATYRRAVHTALKEVEDALSNAQRNQAQEQAQLAIKAEAERSLQLSQLRYREGADDLNSVLDAQRTLFGANDSLAQLRLLRLTASLDIFKALGGGWTRESTSTLASAAS